MRLGSCVVLAVSCLFLSGIGACQSESPPDEDLDSLVNPGGNGIGNPGAGGNGGVVGDPVDTGASDAGAATDGTATDGSAFDTGGVVDPARQARIVRVLDEAASACATWCELRVVCIASVDLRTCVDECTRLPDNIDRQLDQSAAAVRCAESIRDTFRCTRSFTCEDVYNVQVGFDNDCVATFSDANVLCRPYSITPLGLLYLN
jgi:hypothetical protein